MTTTKRIAVQKKVLSRNDEIAARVRKRFEERGILAINILGSPGSGKTSLVEVTAKLTAGRVRAAALSGDQATENDAARIREAGMPALQITTGNECHLNAERIEDVLDRPQLSGIGLLLIENVGNLICPAAYDLGEAAKVAVLSVAEGDDKPLKYPGLFQRAELLIINKIDMLALTDFDPDRARENALEVAPHLDVISLSCRSGEGVSGWYRWLAERVPALSPASALI